MSDILEPSWETFVRSLETGELPSVPFKSPLEPAYVRQSSDIHDLQDAFGPIFDKHIEYYLQHIDRIGDLKKLHIEYLALMEEKYRYLRLSLEGNLESNMASSQISEWKRRWNELCDHIDSLRGTESEMPAFIDEVSESQDYPLLTLL